MNKRLLTSPDPPTKREKTTLRILILIGVSSCIFFCYWFFQEEYIGHPLLYGMMAAIFLYSIAKRLNLWYHYYDISAPEEPKQVKAFSADIFTTFYPGEPYEMVVNTLRAIQSITYPHTAYLCDEADDPYLAGVCAELGVIHVTRDNRINAKAGNINNALKQATGEICLILDPDHIPLPNFLDRVIPHFQNPKIGFVQVVQTYYNKFETLVAKGASQQTYHFYGPMMMTMNTYGSVNAIGANCTFRRSALDEIGGHAAGLAEDMHTAMLLYEKGWQSVYVPEVLARGLAPSTLSAYYKQQLKWARGTFALLFKVYPRIFWSITIRQRIHYAWSFLHYLSGIFYLIGFLLPGLSLLLSETPWRGEFTLFILLFSPLFFSSLVIRYYVQKWLIEENERGFHVVGGLLELATWWVFTLGFCYSLLHKKVPYLPTPKDDKERIHFVLLIPNILLIIFSLFAIGYGLPRDLSPFSILMAGFCLLNASLLSFSLYLAIGSSNKISDYSDDIRSGFRRLRGWVVSFLLKGLDVITWTVRGAPLPIALLLVSFPVWLIIERGAFRWNNADDFNYVISSLQNDESIVDTAELYRIPQQQDSLSIVKTRVTFGQLMSARQSITTYRQFPVPKLRAVGYHKVENWQNSHYPLSGKPILNDFREVKNLGFNALVIKPPGIFRHNFFLFAEEVDLGLLIRLPTPDLRTLTQTDFSTSSLDLATKVVLSYHDEPQLWGYVIDVADSFGSNKYSPFEQKQIDNYSSWLTATIVEIKKADLNRPVILRISPQMIEDLALVSALEALRDADLLAIRLLNKSSVEKNETLQLLEVSELLAASLPASLAATIPKQGLTQHLVVERFQNTWQNNRISFDGLIDFSGRRKTTSLLLQGFPDSIVIPPLNIIPPAQLLYPGQYTKYYAAVLQENSWEFASEESALTFEWMLVKKSPLGRHNAIKPLANGPELTLEIPESYEQYELRLTATDGVLSRSIRAPLNIPLKITARDTTENTVLPVDTLANEN